MAKAPEERNRVSQALLRLRPSALTAMRLLLLLFAISIVAFWAYFRFTLERTIVVNAITGAIEVELSSELSGKAFRDVWICKRSAAGEVGVASPDEPIGCPRTHHLVGPLALETPVLPSGTLLTITSLPDSLRIDVRSLPSHYRDTDIGELEGGAYILQGTNTLENFGTLPLSGKIHLGALFSETDRISITEGNFQIRGYTPVGLIGGEMRELRVGELQSGARVRFVDHATETANGHAAITMANSETALMRVTAISQHATSNLAVGYYFTEEVTIRPSFLEAIILDPLFQLIVTILGAVAGYGWLRRMLAL